MLIDRQFAHSRILMTLALAMALRIAPFPGILALLNPDWVLLFLAYWAMTLPEQVGILYAWSFGLLTDVLIGNLLGQYATVYSIIVYLCLRHGKRIMQFSLVQQAIFIFFCQLLSQLLLFFILNAQYPAQLQASFWLPVLTGAFSWPFVYSVLHSIRLDKPVR